MEQFLNIDIEFLTLIIIFALTIFFAIYQGVKSNFTRMSAIRSLQKYLKTNQIKFELKNPYVELRLVNGIFYCKERTNGKKQGRFFYVNDDYEALMTSWGLINGFFKNNTKYNKLKDFYLKISAQKIYDVDEYDPYDLYGQNWFGQRRRFNLTRTIASSYANPHFHESKTQLYPDFILNEAQNEYCRLTLKREGDNFYILCEEIWGTRNFIIECDNPEAILNEFKLFRNKMLDYPKLLKLYKYAKKCNIKFPNDNKYIYEDSEMNDKLKEKLSPNVEKSETSEPEEHEIKKNNEREVDL